MTLFIGVTVAAALFFMTQSLIAQAVQKSFLQCHLVKYSATFNITEKGH